METAAEMVAVGLDPLSYLRTRDEVERELLIKISNEAISRREVYNRNLAIMIAEEVSKMFK